jgi:hypothetical protein
VCDARYDIARMQFESSQLFLSKDRVDVGSARTVSACRGMNSKLKRAEGNRRLHLVPCKSWRGFLFDFRKMTGLIRRSYLIRDSHGAKDR